MTWFEAIHYSSEVKPIEVQKATDKQIVLAGGRRQAIDSEWSRSFPTRQQAVEYQRDRLTRAVESLTRAVESLEYKPKDAKSKLERLK